ncbi:MAG: hypothetical protein ACRCWR_05465 [Saezia sp.]
MMTPIYCFTFFLLIFAISEVIAEKTKAIISTTLAIAVIILIAFWLGLPKEAFDISTINTVGMLLVGILITSLGTMLDFKELRAQWKTVIISLTGCLAGVAVILVIGPLFLSPQESYAGSAIFAGGNAAALIMTATAKEKGMPDLGTLVVLLLVTQNFIGIPVSSLLLRKAAQKFKANPDMVKAFANVSAQGHAGIAKRKLLQLPASLSKPSMRLAKIALVASLSFFISKMSNGAIHYFVIALLMGVVFSELGFLEKNILTLTDSSGFIVFTTTVVIFSSLSSATPTLLLLLIKPLLLVLGLGTIGVLIGGFIISKVLKVSPYLGIPMGLSCTFGFPTTLLMPREIANAIGQTEEERTAITNYLLPKMVTAGFITVTIASVLIAGFLAKWI